MENMLFCSQLPTTCPLTNETVTSSSYPKNNLEKPFSSPKFGPKKINRDASISLGFSSPVPPISRSRLTASLKPSADHVGVDSPKSKIQLRRGDLRPEFMPKHVAVIMDGHGRWAQERGLPVQQGHLAGHETLKQLILNCCEFGIKVITVYAFSTENWKRSKEEVDFLMSAYEDVIRSFVKEQVAGRDLRFSVIGDKSRLPRSFQSTISSLEDSAKTNKGTHFVMALSYSGQYEIVQASKKLAKKVEDGTLRATDINDRLFEQQLLTNITEFPSPDLLIRTSGELRVSNFLLWQLAYTEFYFSSKLFPDFKEADLVEALTCFQTRQRRYGERKD
uniref:Alkyl transferase n=1 Tax=Leucophyllum frutescens TaxID=86643 RepID=A0A7G6J4K4_LEUFR|nr:cis-prenyl transferase 3 [Leucophyllum frutescens]